MYQWRLVLAAIVLYSCSTRLHAQDQTVSSLECRALFTSLAEVSAETLYGDDPIVLFTVPSDRLDFWPSGLIWNEFDILEVDSLAQTNRELGLQGSTIEMSLCDFEPDNGEDAACAFVLVREPSQIRGASESYKVVLEALFSGDCIGI